MARLRLTGPAKSDIAGLLDWSASHFGFAGRRRYLALLETALKDVAKEPDRAGSREEPQLGPGIRVYHMKLSRDRVERKSRVRSPRHVVVYRSIPDEDVIVVLRILHDAMDIVRHVPKEEPEP